MRASILSAAGTLGLLLAGGAAHAAPPPNNHRFDASFDKADKNKNGYLDAEELAKAFRGPNAKVIEDKLGAKGETHPDHAFLDAWDADKDGKISKAEFEKYEAKAVADAKAAAARAKSSYSRGGRSRYYSPYTRGGYRAGKSHHHGRRRF